jgi:hypothetical protein
MRKILKKQKTKILSILNIKKISQIKKTCPSFLTYLKFPDKYPSHVFYHNQKEPAHKKFHT